MQIAPEQGAFKAWLAGLTGARRCLELVTFTGYSALAVASKPARPPPVQRSNAPPIATRRQRADPAAHRT